MDYQMMLDFSNIYSTLATLTTLSAIQSNNNVFTGTNTFNLSLNIYFYKNRIDISLLLPSQQ